MTSIATKRPQLNLDELHQLKWLLGGALTLLSAWTVLYMDVEAWTLMFLISAATLAVIVWPTLPRRVPPLVHTLAFPGIVAFFAADLWLKSEVLPAMVRLDMLLLLYRGITYRQRRDDLQIIVLGLFLIVVAGVLTVSLTFAAQLLVYTACALAFLLLITLIDSALGAHRPPPQPIREAPAWAVHADWGQLFRRLRDVADWRVIGFGAALFAGVVMVSALLFLAIPRFQIESSMFLDRFISKKTRTGFSDTIRFGDVSEITQDNGVALSVDVSDQTRIPATPYWRMIVLDYYDNGTFKFSLGLRRWFESERTAGWFIGAAKPRRGAPVYWTFYLEPGVSRFLPLVGPFMELRFQETQNFRFHRPLSLVALREEPVTMTAYRVQDFDLASEVPDLDFAQRWRRRNEPGANHIGLQIRTLNNDADVATLTRLVAEIEDGSAAAAPARWTAGEFARRAGVWLRRHHSYTLSPHIPATDRDRDPLVSWLASGEAGHCELFAGSLVLLARTAGFPAHVVTGFKGGSWNGYSNNFTIHNADAHAWAEVFDERAGVWLRADALGISADAEKNSPTGEAAIARRLDRSWTARFDSLRIFWYRRIVSFDQQAQAQTLKAVKQATQESGRRLREALLEAFAATKAWLAKPWDPGRVMVLVTTIAGAAGIAWAGWRLRFRFLEIGWTRRRGLDPVRREAGRLLVRWRAMNPQGPAMAGDEQDAVVADLQRLRFGPREAWPDPEKIFRRARRALRDARRRRAELAER